MTIINIRGTNGSGKSTVARALIEAGETREIELATYTTGTGKPRSVLGYAVPGLDLIVVGKYATACGGCDAIKTQDLICESVRIASKVAHNVIFESVIVSTLFGRYHQLSIELGGIVWAYLNTPVEICLSRIQKRNGGKQIKENLVFDKIKAIKATREKAVIAGEKVIDLDWQNAEVEVRRLLA